MDILVITTGGTFDKVYFDAKSDYQVGEPYVGNLLEEGNVTLNYEILSILKKDSLDIYAHFHQRRMSLFSINEKVKNVV